MQAFVFTQTPGTPQPPANTGHSHSEQDTGDFVVVLPLYLRPPCSSSICHGHHQVENLKFTLWEPA